MPDTIIRYSFRFLTSITTIIITIIFRFNFLHIRGIYKFNTITFSYIIFIRPCYKLQIRQFEHSTNLHEEEDGHFRDDGRVQIEHGLAVGS